MSHGDERDDADAEPRAPPAVPDAPALLAVLVSHEVDFVVVGGIAVAYHGYLRATKDVDVVPNPAAENLRRLWDALVELEASPESLRDLRPSELPLPLSFEALLQLGNWDLATRYGRLDVLQFIQGALEDAADYARLRERGESSRHDFGTIWFASYEDLIDLKTIAGRDQDLIDIRALREAREDTNP